MYSTAEDGQANLLHASKDRKKIIEMARRGRLAEASLASHRVHVKPPVDRVSVIPAAIGPPTRLGCGGPAKKLSVMGALLPSASVA